MHSGIEDAPLRGSAIERLTITTRALGRLDSGAFADMGRPIEFAQECSPPISAMPEP